MTCIRGSRNHLKDNAKEKDKKQTNKQKRYTFEYDRWWYFIETAFSRDNYFKEEYVEVNSNNLLQSAFEVLKSFVLSVLVLENINGGTLTEEKTDRVRNSKTKTILRWNLTHTAEYNPSFLNYVF